MKNGKDHNARALRSLSGLKAQRIGKSFEDYFYRSCIRYSVSITKIPDGCRSVGRGIRRVQSPFDWILSFQGKSAFIDTKTLDDKMFPAGMILQHQALACYNHEIQGIIAGYIAHLRAIDRVVYIPASRLLQSLKDRLSIRIDDPHLRIIGTEAELNPRRLFALPALDSEPSPLP